MTQDKNAYDHLATIIAAWDSWCAALGDDAGRFDEDIAHGRLCTTIEAARNAVMTAEPCPDCGVTLNRSPNYGRCPECGRVSTLCLAVDSEQPREQYIWPVAKPVTRSPICPKCGIDERTVTVASACDCDDETVAKPVDVHKADK